MNKFIPLSIPNFTGNERKYVDQAVDEGWVSTGGGFVTRMEEQLAEFLHTEAVACCQSGTSALHLSLIDAGVRPGDLVLVPPVTFIAAVNPIRYQFAQPVFVDCDDSLCMDPMKLRSFCEQECELNNDVLTHKVTGKAVRAVVVVHVFGNMADMEAVMDIANDYHLKVIEDATEALGTRYTEGRYKGKFAGTIGDYGAYSFNGNKIITTGGGGAVTAISSQAVKHLKYLSTQAKNDPHYYIHHEVGYNYRMTNLQAAVGCAQMETLSEFIMRKHEMYDRYDKLFAGWIYGRLFPFRQGTYSNQWFFSLQLDMDKLCLHNIRDVVEALGARNVQTRAIWGLINEQLPYLNDITYKLEKSKFYSRCILNIPSSTQLTNSDVEYAAGIIKKTIEQMCGKEKG